MTRRTPIPALGFTAALGLVLVTAAPAVPIEADRTVLVSRPAGFGALPPDDVANSTLTSNRPTSSDGRHVVFGSRSDGLAPGDVYHCFVRDRQTGVTTLIDRSTTGTPGNGGCSQATISGDATAIAFTSSSDNLVADDTNRRPDVFVRDLQTGATYRVSVDAAGGQLTAGGERPSITVTGGLRGTQRRVHVAFTTTAAIDAQDLGDAEDVYLRSGPTLLGPATTTLVSRPPGGLPSIGGADASISGDATRIAFVTSAKADDGDTNDVRDVYLRDTAADTTTLVSRPTGAAGVQNGRVTTPPAIARDGSTVAFDSSATNLGGVHPDPALAASNIYTRVIATGVTTPVSVVNGTPATLADRSAILPSISDDGSHIAFSGTAANLADGAPEGWHVHVRSVDGPPTTTWVSRADGPSGAPAEAHDGAGISGNDATVVFTGNGEGVVPGVDTADAWQVYVRDPALGTTRLVSRPSGADGVPYLLRSGASAPGETSQRTASAGGRHVVFVSESPAIGDGPAGIPQVYRRDMLTGEVRLVSRAPDGTPGADRSTDPVISGDGSVVAFTTYAPNLGVTTQAGQIAVWSASTDRLTLVSIAADGTLGDRTSETPSLSESGSRVAFTSEATNLGTTPPPSGTHVWVRDIPAGATLLASRGDGPLGAPLAQGAFGGVISGDGRRVAFTTASPDAANGDTGAGLDVHVRDLAAGRTLWASRPDGHAGTGDGLALRPSLNGDGTIVAFQSSRPLLTSDDPDAEPDVFTRNLTTGATVLQSRASGADGVKADGPATAPVISTDGTRVAFGSTAGNLVRDDLNDRADVFVRDSAALTTTGVSRVDGANGTLLGAVLTGISSGGLGGDPAMRCVVFASLNPALVPDGYRSTDFTQVYLRSVGAPCAAVTAGPGGPGGTARVNLSAASLRPNLFRAGTRRGRGSTLRFTLTGAARVTAVVQRPRAGRITAGTCRIGRRTGRKCTVWTRVARFTVQARTGTTTRRFTAVFNRRALAPGRYRLRLTPTGGTTRTITFRVTGAPR